MTGAASNAVFAADLRYLSGQTVEIRTASTVNDYGERAYTGTAQTYRCHVEAVTSQPLGVNDDAIVEYAVHIPSIDLAVDTDSEIKLPSPISGTRPIVRIVERFDGVGRCGWTIFVGRAAGRR
jgi:hypothetical protein